MGIFSHYLKLSSKSMPQMCLPTALLRLSGVGETVVTWETTGRRALKSESLFFTLCGVSRLNSQTDTFLRSFGSKSEIAFSKNARLSLKPDPKCVQNAHHPSIPVSVISVSRSAPTNPPPPPLALSFILTFSSVVCHANAGRILILHYLGNDGSSLHKQSRLRVE